MHIITKKALKEFYIKYPDSRNALLRWYKILCSSSYNDFAELKTTFSNSVDIVGNKIVFNISGNKYRLIASIHFNRHKIFVRNILTHKEYDKSDWK